ncbi:MAG: M20/M25/M40 family metallo-hydrolase [Hyphomicrobiales bacterium]
MREQILAWIDQDRDTLIGFLSRFTAVPSPNPPGDTSAAARFLLDHLQAHGFPAEIRAAKPELPNIVGSFGGAGPHLVLNGHIDVFPAGPAETWSRDPWSGAVAGGRIHGRGVVDMKCGTAASIWTAIYLNRLRDRLGGRLTLTCVSDEETGGTWGARWLLEAYPDECRGDCCLNGEPSAGTIRFGEKGTLRLIFEIDTPGAHAAYTHLSSNAIRIASELVRDLYRLEEMRVMQSDAVRGALEASRATMDAVLGEGAGGILDRITVSPGVIQGGLKINMLPGHRRIEVDIRLPVGTTQAQVMGEVDTVLRRYPEARVTPVRTHSSEPSFSDPGHRMVGILRDTVSALTGRVPVPTVSLGGSDAKHWRSHGVPAYLYGCAPNNMAKPDEWVDIEEYLNVVRSHALAAASFLAG